MNFNIDEFWLIISACKCVKKSFTVIGFNKTTLHITLHITSTWTDRPIDLWILLPLTSFCRVI